jgi:hypothetical protein
MNTLMKSILLYSCFNACMSHANLPSDLLFHDKPIDALCLNIQEPTKTVNLNQCGLSKEKYVLKEPNQTFTKQQFQGFTWQDPNYPNVLGYSYYQFFNAGDKQYWLYTLNNGGGNGEFTNILLMKRLSQDEISLQVMQGGERCQGGIEAVSERDNVLSYSSELTAYDLFSLSPQASSQIKAYDSLAACAVCCVAKASYTLHAGGKPQLNAITLGKVATIDELPTQGNKQACFNELLFDKIQKGQNKIDPKELNELISAFQKKCVHESE